MNFLFYVLIYIFLLIVWLIINLIFYALSLLFKKNLSQIPFGLNYIINFIIGIYLLFYPFYYIWQIITSKQWLLFILVIIFGNFIYHFWAGLISLIIIPFNAISNLFLNNLDNKLKDKGQDFDYEIISPEGKILEKTSSESKINKRLALFFLISYGVNLLYILNHPNKYKMIGFLDYIFTPGFFMAQNILIFGVILGMFNLIKHRKFIFLSWKVFLTSIFKIDIILNIGIQILATIIYFLNY